MNITVTNYIETLCFWLVFTRWLAISFQLPLFDNDSIPVIVKILFNLVISYAFYPLVKANVIQDIHYFGQDNFWTLTVFYTVIGLVIGYLVKAIMNLFVAAGSIITQQIGFQAVSYFDPNFGTQVGPFEKIIQWTLLIIILTSGALFPMFRGVFHSFGTVQASNLGSLTESPEFFFHVFKGIFLSALLLASPLIFINMLIMAILGVVSRTVPQMNIIMVSFVINIGLGLLVFVTSSGEFFHVAFKLYTEKLGEWFQFIV